MSSTNNNSEVSYETWKAIDTHLTFRAGDLFRTIAHLTIWYFGPPSPQCAHTRKLRAMVTELERLGIRGYERTKAWTVWYVETARFVFECESKVKAEYCRAGMDWMVRPEGEFRNVAGALYEVLAEDLGFGFTVGK